MSFSRWQKRGLEESTRERERAPTTMRTSAHGAAAPTLPLRGNVPRGTWVDRKMENGGVAVGGRNEDVNGGCEGG